LELVAYDMTRGNQWRGNRDGSISASRSGSRPTRRPTSTRNEIYDDLLDEALQQIPQEENRPLKKRKSQRDPSHVITIDDASSEVEENPRNAQDVIMVESSDSDIQQTDDEDEMDWDDVDLAALPTSEDTAADTKPTVREVTLTTTPNKSTYTMPWLDLTEQEETRIDNPSNCSF
jgi:hypothetical protein